MTRRQEERALRHLSVSAEDMPEELRAVLLEGAESTVLALTGRLVLPDALVPLLARMAAARYHLIGMEGEKTRREGSLVVEKDSLPEDILREIRAWRLAGVVRCGG